MKYIINGGLSTKTIPSYSKDAILLALNESRIDGVLLNLYVTRDNKIVVFDCATVDNEKEKLQDLTLEHLRRRNFQAGVRKHSIVELSELLKLFKDTNKLLLLNIEATVCSERMIDNLLEETAKYPNTNIYIQAEDKEVLCYLQEKAKRQRIGLSISEKAQNMWQEIADFYAAGDPKNNLKNMDSKMGENKRIMIAKINTLEEFQQATEDLGISSNKVYWLIKDTSLLTKVLLEQLKN